MKRTQEQLQTELDAEYDTFQKALDRGLWAGDFRDAKRILEHAGEGLPKKLSSSLEESFYFVLLKTVHMTLLTTNTSRQVGTFEHSLFEKSLSMGRAANCLTLDQTLLQENYGALSHFLTAP